jgi:hypothetical protein
MKNRAEVPSACRGSVRASTALTAAPLCAGALLTASTATCRGRLLTASTARRLCARARLTASTARRLLLAGVHRDEREP